MHASSRVASRAAANIGAGVADSNAICVTVGTSAAARTVIRTVGDHAPQLSPGLWVRPLARSHWAGG